MNHEVTKALNRMIEIADSRGSYSLDGMDARHLETALAEIEWLRSAKTELLTKALEVEAERDIARHEIERLRAALKPFAASAYDRDGLPDEWEIRVALGDLRRARSVLNQQQGSKA